MAVPTLETLPGEILLLILAYLEPYEIARLQRVSGALCRACRDPSFWRVRTFDDSLFRRALERRTRLFGKSTAAAATPETDGAAAARARTAEKTRILANWDPVFPGEAVSWYDEWVQRNAPVAVSWFERPRRIGGIGGIGTGGEADDDPLADAVDVLGVALYRPGGGTGGSGSSSSSDQHAPPLLAVAPLQDGSVCLWDVSGRTTGRPGAIFRRSGAGLLSGPTDEAFLFLGSDDCVSVDSGRDVAYVSVWDRLVEVSLTTLSVVSVVQYPWTISALSAAHPSTPLTVGLGHGIHLHDARTGGRYSGGGGSLGFRSVDEMVTARVEAAACSAHPAPGPLAILHMPAPYTTGAGTGSDAPPSHDIYTAGRFPSILHYDRRNLAAVQEAIHSGASLAGLAALPFPFGAVDAELRRQGLLSAAQVAAAKAPAPAAGGGRTLLACGDYKAKGSLELYGIGPMPNAAGGSCQAATGTMKNRHTTSPSRLLAVAVHGTRIVVADSMGFVRWFERDGFTEVRRHYLEEEGGAKGEEEGEEAFSRAGLLARKLLPTEEPGINGNRLVVWTGDRLGLLGFSTRPRFGAADFAAEADDDDDDDDDGATTAARAGKTYRATMRRFFHDVRTAGEFGL